MDFAGLTDSPARLVTKLPRCHCGAIARIVNGLCVGYVDASNVSHGFLRNPDGTITPFDAPGAVNGTDTAGVDGINPEGAITGHYFDASNVSHGFLYNPDGTIIAPIDAPGAGTVPGQGQGTIPTSNNPLGAITGFYIDANNVFHGFLRAP